MNIKQIITVGIAVMTMGAFALDKVEVTNVVARQRYPWNGKVDIDFKVVSKATEPCQMYVEVFDNVGKTNLPVRSVCTENVSVEANPCMVRTDTTRLVWDASKDLPNGFKCTNVLVSCRDDREIAESNRYMIVELSSGSVSYTNCPPLWGWTDEYKTTKLLLRKINAGTFMMGSPESEIGRQSNEDYHQVTLTRDYYIGVFEVTEQQWSLVMGGSDSTKKPVLKNYIDVRGNYKQGDSWGYSKSPTCWPDSESVSDSSFVGVLRSRTGISTFDLPTEAEWECAAKGNTITAVNNGFAFDETAVDEVGRNGHNYTDGKGDAALTTITYVGMYMPNALGIYDMLGNTPEWCVDVYDEYDGHLGTSAVTDPKGAAAVLRTGDGCWMCHVLKGGGSVGGWYMKWLGSTCGPGYNNTFTPLHAHRSAARATTTGTYYDSGYYSDRVTCGVRIKCYVP